jgi:hypothetical protein
MIYRLFTSVLVFLCINTFAQKTLLVEKIGTSRKYYYHLDDKIKLRTKSKNLLIKGNLTTINDSTIFVSTGLKAIPVHDIGSVYKQYGFPRRLGIKLGEAGIVFFIVLTINNLINKKQVFPPYTYIITGSCFAGGLISFSLRQHRCEIGDQWKLKILDLNVK